MGAVRVGGIEEGDAGVNGVVDEGDHVGIRLRRAVKSGHAHTAMSLCRYLKALRAKLDSPHCCHFLSLGYLCVEILSLEKSRREEEEEEEE